mmetsp:Transcript_24282/g.66434  ORF Transcript_24282/g.66434 Transcript_24282/m.66434 type:complete len:238 (-) Transcript_24282:108-821(-)
MLVHKGLVIVVFYIWYATVDGGIHDLHDVAKLLWAHQLAAQHRPTPADAVVVDAIPARRRRARATLRSKRLEGALWRLHGMLVVVVLLLVLLLGKRHVWRRPKGVLLLLLHVGRGYWGPWHCQPAPCQHHGVHVVLLHGCSLQVRRQVSQSGRRHQRRDEGPWAALAHGLHHHHHLLLLLLLLLQLLLHRQRRSERRWRAYMRGHKCCTSSRPMRPPCQEGGNIHAWQVGCCTHSRQ